MAEVIPGSARLNARAILCHPRYSRSGPPSIFFDANVQAVRTLEPRLERPILCSLRYRVFLPGQFLHPGAYDIVATVSLPFI